MPKPVKEGDVVDITIEAVGARGDGIGKIEGFVVFVPNCSAGEKVKVRIVQVRERNAIGERMEEAGALEKPSETAETESEKDYLPAQAKDEGAPEGAEQEPADEDKE